MEGKITFDTIKELAEFLKHFSGSGAVFTVEKSSSEQWVLNFTGGY